MDGKILGLAYSLSDLSEALGHSHAAKIADGIRR
ncbi:hypothetical protein STRAU_4280 [Streptomyces aurantiacus JA 4570]|uniref:Uncharacterized protein n=1 Tax=Streptomyces aurantiacus JA 4570 TaxID=1286094 RepID=S3ZHT8_9ACTN|nr:hypothetical protein STRAU_4280 [Streptomyces aurantiacus JA 4570]